MAGPGLDHHRLPPLHFLYLIGFIDLFSVSLFLPLLSKEIKDLGGDPLLIGIIGSVYGAVQLVSSPLMGWGSDRYGSKFVLFLCLIFSAFAYILQGMSSNLMLLLVARTIAGCFKHTQTIGKSIITTLAPKEKASVLGNFNAFGSMGFIVGPTIGAHLVELQGHFMGVCMLAALGFLVNSFILAVFVKHRAIVNGTGAHMKKNDNIKKTDSDDDYGKGSCSIFTLKRYEGMDLPYSVTGILLLRFVYSSSTIIPRANLPLILESKYGTSVVEVGYLNSSQAAVSTLLGFAVGPVISRLYLNNAERVVLHAGILKTMSLAALVFAPSFPIAALSMCMQSAADPFLRIGITSMSLEGHDDPGTILGLGQTATSLSRMIGPTAAGLSQTFSIDGPAVFGTCMASFGLIWSCMSQRKKQFGNGSLPQSDETSHPLITKKDKYDPSSSSEYDV